MPLFLRFTATMAFCGLLYELCLAICIKTMGLQLLYEEDPVFRRRLRLNRKMMYVFTFLTTIYTCMACDWQYVHKGWIAEYHGGHQIVYSFRYIEWVCCAPIVLSISGQLPHTADGSPRNALVPSSMLTGIYCIISWQGIVVTDFYWAWVLIFWAFVSYFLASYEQLHFAWWVKDQGTAGPVRAALLVYLVIMIGIYGVVYLLPIPGWVTATFENKFYCLGDVSFKVGTSVMLLATNDLANNEEMRRRAEATADDLRRLINTASVPIFGVDTKGFVNQWNMKTADLTGLPEALAMGLPLVKMLGESSQADAGAFIRNALEGKDIGTLETSIYPKGMAELENEEANGLVTKKAMLVLSASPTKDKQGGIKGVSLVGCDLTDVAAYREAEQRKVRFMAVVSHELRSPLHGIIGLMDHLCDTEKQEGRLRFMKLVKNCANRLLDLVVNIMEMASMVSSHDGSAAPTKKLARDPVELSKILDEIVMLVKSSTDKGGNPLVKKSVQLVNDVQALPIIEADAHKCTQVFYNLVTNACKFTMQGTITLAGNVDPEGMWVEVSVTDTGKGIARGSLERIFQPFEQEDNSAIRGYQGIGLGLSIAHEVVRGHGGTIKVESELEVGTTFTVRLPVVMCLPMKANTEKAKSAAEQPSLLDSFAEPGPRVVLGPEGPMVVPREIKVFDKPRAPETARRPVILSADDDEVNQQVVTGILSDYDVHIAMDGIEALAFLEKCEEPPDLMLLDIMMPNMSGYEVCKIVREKLGIGPAQMPILMLSASSMDSSIIEAYDSGANDYVSKPFDKQVLNAHVRAALRLRADHMAARSEPAPRSPARCASYAPEAMDDADAADDGVRRRRA